MTLVDTTRETAQRIYKEIDTFMKRDYNSIYRLSGAFLADFPFDDKPITRAYIAINEAIKMLPKESQIIIEDRYIKQVTHYKTLETLNIGKTAYYRYMKRAFYEFAECLKVTCKVERLDYKELIS